MVPDNFHYASLMKQLCVLPIAMRQEDIASNRENVGASLDGQDPHVKTAKFYQDANMERVRSH